MMRWGIWLPVIILLLRGVDIPRSNALAPFSPYEKEKTKCKMQNAK